MVARGENLPADARRVAGHERQQPVRGGGGDDFEQLLILKLAEGGNQVAVVMPPSFPCQTKFMVIHPR